ncbi:MAG: VWA domain-containing protein [Acidobacteria bacterium]|nr:VWA domain-containing protein [Acidobacteriota bacterium]
MLKRSLFLLMVFAVLGGVVAAQQSPAPPRPSGQTPQGPPPVTFKLDVSLVEVDAIVTDRAGNVIRDLTLDEFEVYEDGRRQTVDVFSLVDIPIVQPERPLFAETPIEPDVKTNTEEGGRIYVILLDDLHTHPLRTPLVKRAAKQFIDEYLGANDVAAVLHTSGRADASQEFTSSKRLLSASVDRFMGRKLRSATLGRLDEYYRQRDLPATSSSENRNRRINDPDDFERGYQARTALDTLKNVADYLTGLRGRRKALVFFSEGIDYDIYDVFESRDATTIQNSVRDAIGAATRANVAFYTVDPRGLATMGDEAIEIGGLPEDHSLNLGPQSMQSELRLAQDSLRVLAEQTGGVAAVNSNDFAGAFDRIVRDNSVYYVLGYYPTNDRRDGRVRKIDVRVTRPGAQVRSRKAYVAPRGRAPAPRVADANEETSAALREVLSSPLPSAGLPMAVHAAAFKGTAPNASVAVAVQVDGRLFKFDEKDGLFHDTLELSMFAADTSGKIRNGDRTSVDLKLRPQTRQAVDAAGFRVLTRLDLPPGRYQLRVGGRATNSGSTGSVFYDLEVPDFAKERFSMSGLVLTSATAAITPTGRADEDLKGVLPGPVTTARDFLPIDTLALFVEVYDNDAATPHTVDITTTVRADDGRVVFKTEDERSSREIGGARGGFGYTAEIPLKDIAPGLYVLRVEGKSRLKDAPEAVRETMFRVWPMPEPARPEPTEGAREAARSGAIVNVLRGFRSEVDEYREVVARSEQEWEALWAGLPNPGGRSRPKVSFENTMIAGLFLGSRPTTGYHVEFVGVRLDGDTLVIEYVEGQPAEGLMQAQVITTPFAVAGVPLHTGPVRFERVAPQGR